MTQKEMAALLAINKCNYPYAYEKMTKEEREILLDTWLKLFGKYEAAFIRHAFERALEVCKMPVTPADIFDQIGKLKSAIGQSLDELWQIFIDAANQAEILSRDFKWTLVEANGLTQGQNAKIKAQVLFDGLPGEIKTYCGNVRRLIDYGGISDDKLLQFIKPEFMRRIKEIREQAQIKAETPKQIFELIGFTAKTVDGLLN